MSGQARQCGHFFRTTCGIKRGTDTKKTKIEEEMVMPDASLEDELPFSLEIVAVHSSTVSTSHSTAVLKPKTLTFGDEAADRVVVSSLESDGLEIGCSEYQP